MVVVVVVEEAKWWLTLTMPRIDAMLGRSRTHTDRNANQHTHARTHARISQPTSHHRPSARDISPSDVICTLNCSFPAWAIDWRC